MLGKKLFLSLVVHVLMLRYRLPDGSRVHRQARVAVVPENSLCFSSTFPRVEVLYGWLIRHGDVLCSFHKFSQPILLKSFVFNTEIGRENERKRGEREGESRGRQRKTWRI